VPPSPSGPDLILVPTALELSRLDALGALPESLGPRALCGFGPVSAAARTAQLLVELRPRRVLLLGIAGSLSLERAPLEGARSFGRVRLDGVGAGAGASFLPPSRLGFPQWDGEERIDETLSLSPGGQGELLTVCAASASPEEARARRDRYPDAAAEDMEGFGVALACRLACVPLAIVRGISNPAGVRERAAWRVGPALRAARTLALEWLARRDWGLGQGG
jgi:futalosine hydrolase